MNNKKATKRALLTSVMALVMCVVMLVGTTFAWFTDTASTGVNKIQAGNLDVDIVGADPVDGKYPSLTGEGHKLSFTKAGTEVGTDNAAAILWEPGCRYVTEGFRIANKGNLALKWKAVVNKGTTAENPGKFDLLDVIDFYLVTSKDVNDMGTELNEFSDKLAAKTNSGVYYIKGVMKTTAGNDYQGLTLDGITITVYATQDNVENDSFGPDYDKNATYYPVIDLAGLKDALGRGGNITIAGDFTGDATKTAAGDRLTIKTPTTLNFEGVYTVPGSLEDSANWAALYITDATTINAIDGAGIICEDKTDSSAAYIGGPYVAHINAPGKTVTVNGGTYYGGCTTFNVQKGTLIVNGGFFQVTPDNGTNDCRYTLNCIDANYGNGSAKIIVKGGTFVNFNPADCKAEGAGTNFVADGYSVISETKANGDVWYTVVKGTGATAGTQKDLTDAITNNTTSTVKLTTDGTYTLPTDKMANKDVTIIGTKDTVIDMKNVATGQGTSNAKIALEGVTVEFANATYKGFQHTGKLTYKDCTIIGQQFLYATEVEFINCTFEQDSSDAYNVWTYSAGNVLFKDCTFDCKGKAVLIYNEGHISSQNVEFQNCKFNASTPVADKAAIEIDSRFTSYNVTIDKATSENVSGFGTSTASGSSVWNVKAQGTNTTVTVTIDGAKVN